MKLKLSSVVAFVHKFYQKAVRFNALRKAKKPSKLPRGLTEFKEWADSIISLYGLPDNDSSRWMLAVALIHYPDGEDKAPKAYFGLRGLRAMSSEVASYVMRDLKEKQQAQIQAAQTAALQAKSAEVTAQLQQGTSSGSEQQGVQTTPSQVV